MANLAEIRKGFPATVLILALLFSAVAGAQFVNLGVANPRRGSRQKGYIDYIRTKSGKGK